LPKPTIFMHKGLLQDFLFSSVNRAYNSYDSEAFRTGNIGVTLLKMGQYSEAINTIQTAINMRKALLPLLPEDNIDNNNRIAVLLNAIGACYQGLKDYSKSEEFYLASIQHRQSTLGEDDSGLVSVYYNLACLYLLDSTKYHKVLETLQKGISIYTSLATIGKGSSQDKDLLIGGLTELGIILKNSGDFDAALVAYHQAVDFRKATGENENSFPFFNLYINIGMTLKGKKEYHKQINYLQKAIDLIENNISAVEPVIYVGILNHALTAAQQLGDKEKETFYTTKLQMTKK